MRKVYLGLVMCAFLALPLCAQQKSGAAGDETNASEKSSAANSAASSTNAVPFKHVFASPATPRPTPFPGPAAAAPDTRPLGTLVPKYEVAVTYDYVNFNPGSPFAGFNNHGAAGSFTYNASKWLGLTAEVGGYQFERNLFPLTGNNNSVQGTFTSYLFGPRVNLRRFNRFIPFAEFLVGAASSSIEITGGSDQSAFALAAGRRRNPRNCSSTGRTAASNYS